MSSRRLDDTVNCAISKNAGIFNFNDKKAVNIVTAPPEPASHLCTTQYIRSIVHFRGFVLYTQ